MKKVITTSIVFALFLFLTCALVGCTNQQTDGTNNVSNAADERKELIFRGLEFGTKFSDAKEHILEDLGVDRSEVFNNSTTSLSYRNVPVTDKYVAWSATYTFQFTDFENNTDNAIFVKGAYLFRSDSLYMSSIADDNIDSIISLLTELYGDNYSIDAKGNYIWNDFSNDAILQVSLSAYIPRDLFVEYISTDFINEKTSKYGF